MPLKRSGKVDRETKETRIRLTLQLDGSGKTGFTPRSLF